MQGRAAGLSGGRTGSGEEPVRAVKNHRNRIENWQQKANCEENVKISTHLLTVLTIGAITWSEQRKRDKRRTKELQLL